MAKEKYKTVWNCTECGADAPKWTGRCPSCGAWNTMVENRVSQASKTFSPSGKPAGASKSVPTPVSAIRAGEEQRINMPSKELNRVLGGGLVCGSLVLIGGEPGIGKSTLVLQNILAIKSKTILYVSAEESATQIKMRADRIGRGSENCFIVCETSLENIFEHIENINPQILIVDSIQTVATDSLESSAGSVSQVRECAARLLAYAKSSGTPIVLIGHITKEGALAGPKVLEHIVEIAPRKIVYVSCDPATLARDLKILVKAGYCLQTLAPVDLFPRTAHVETVVLLEKADINLKN